MRHFRIYICFLLIIGLMSACCLSKPPEQVPGVLVVFEKIDDGDHAKAWVIETEKGKPETRIDSIWFGALNHITGFSFFLEFQTGRENGDFYIHADSVVGSNLISDLELWSEDDKCGNKRYYYHYKFNGFLQTQDNQRILIRQYKP